MVASIASSLISNVLQLNSSNQDNTKSQKFDYGFQSLASAIESGNLNSARQAFNNLTKSLSADALNDPNNPLAKIGKALQAGNMGDAQTLMSKLEKSGYHGNDQATTASLPAVATANPTHIGSLNVSV